MNSKKSDSKNWRKASEAPLKERSSDGIACCRFNGDKPEMLFICKRYTYAFYIFAMGRWNINNLEEIMKLLNEMTIDEKYDLLSLNYVLIWYRIWLSSSARSPAYFRAKNKFESAFVADGGIKLKGLIAKSTHVDKIWEIPKGKKKYKAELDIHCAIREFYEETGITKNSYKIFPVTRSYSFVDAGTKYTTNYFLAFTKHKIEPTINFGRREQLEEVSDIRWMSIEDIRRIDKNNRLENFVKPIFNFMKKYARK